MHFPNFLGQGILVIEPVGKIWNKEIYIKNWALARIERVTHGKDA
jgi:hypothetical protein